jgi:hypothetical protein
MKIFGKSAWPEVGNKEAAEDQRSAKQKSHEHSGSWDFRATITPLGTSRHAVHLGCETWAFTASASELASRWRRYSSSGLRRSPLPVSEPRAYARLLEIYHPWTEG